MKVEEAKKILKENGYYIENLWHISDVQQNYKLDDDDAYNVLDRVMQSEYTISSIFDMIDLEIKDYKL